MRTLPEHNDLIPLLRAISMRGQSKQTGRRYGPPPKKSRTSGAEPMDDTRRERIYAYDIGGVRGWTARQLRQIKRMGRRAFYRENPEGAPTFDGRKGRPTPKRRRSS